MIPERYIFFNEAEHKYTDEYGNPYTPVSNAYGRYKPHFKANYWARVKAREFGTSEASIKKQWKDVNKHSVDKGNRKHNAFESAIKSTSKFSKAVHIVNINNIIRCYSIYDLNKNSDIGEMSLDDFYNTIGYKYKVIFDTIKFYVDLGFKIYSEINVYDPVNLISGTIDVLLVKDDIFIIIDWKTNRNEIKFESGYYKKDKATNELTNIWIPAKSYMLYPMDHLEDCNGIHYSLQLSMYANMIEQFGYTNRGMILFHIRDSYVLNEYGQPKKDKKGIYIVNTNKPEQVSYHVMRYYKKEAETIRRLTGKSVVVKTQKKLIM